VQSPRIKGEKKWHERETREHVHFGEYEQHLLKGKVVVRMLHSGKNGVTSRRREGKKQGASSAVRPQPPPLRQDKAYSGKKA